MQMITLFDSLKTESNNFSKWEFSEISTILRLLHLPNAKLSIFLTLEGIAMHSIWVLKNAKLSINSSFESFAKK